MKLKEQHILKDSFKYSYDTIADIAPPINRYYSQHCYNPPPMNSVLRGRNRNAIFSKSPHGPIFKFLWWFVKWFSENGTNPNTGEFFDPYKPLYKPFQQKKQMAKLPILYWSPSSGPTDKDHLFWEQFPYK